MFFKNLQYWGLIVFSYRALWIMGGLWLMCLHFAQAATITSTGTGGNWNATSTWVGGGVPTTTDDVVIAAGAMVTINQTVTCANLTIDGTLTTTNNYRVVTINGDLIVNGSFDIFWSNPLTVYGHVDVYGSLLDTNGNGSADFHGRFSVSTGGSFSTAYGSAFTFRNGIINNGTFNKTGTGTVAFSTNAQTVSGDNALTIGGAVTISADLNLNVPVTFGNTLAIADNVTVINNRQAIVQGTLNGEGTNAKWKNEAGSTLEYRGAAAPMAVGILDVVATGNTVMYRYDGTQTIRLTDYYHLQTEVLSGTTVRTRQLQTLNNSLNVLGNLTIGQYTVFQHSAADAIQTLTLYGQLINNGSVTLQSSSTRYCDLIFEGSGDLISGSGSSSMRLRNLTFNGTNPKSVLYAGNIDLYSGTSGNAFVNNAGNLTFTNGTVRFLDATSFVINGTGPVAFNNLTCGNYNSSAVVLHREVTINGTLTLNHSTGYLDLNNQTINLLGGFVRSNSGQFRGTTGSVLNLGNGNVLAATGNIYFQSGYQILGQLNHNLGTGTFYYTLLSPLSVANLNISSGQLNNSSNLTITNSYINNGMYYQTAAITYFDKPSGIISVTGSGTNSINTLTVTDGTVEVTGNLDVASGFVSNSNAAIAFIQTAGTTSFVSPSTQNINTGTGTGTVTFYDLLLANGNTNAKIVSRAFDVANRLTVNDNASFNLGTSALSVNVGGEAIIDGILNFGSTAAKTVTIGGDLIDITGSIAMTGTGLSHVLNLNGSHNGISTFTTTASANSTVNYGRNGDQAVFPSANYQNLTFGGSGTKSFQNATTINGNMSVGGTSTGDSNGHIVTTAGLVIIASGATLEIDDNAQLLLGNGKTLTNHGILKVVGSSGNPAVVSRNGTLGGYAIIQSDVSAQFWANHYEFNYLSGGIAISGGSINNANNFSNGSFSNGSGAQYLNLTGADLGGLPTVSNVTFNAGPSANVTRTSGNGAIVFDNAMGALSGENYDNDNGNPGTLVIWNYPASVYYSTGNVSAGLITSWSKNPDGSGGNPSSVTDGLNTLVIQDGHVVTVDNNGNLDIKNLIVGQGVSGALIIGTNAAQQIVTVRENLDVKSGASLTAGSAGSPSHKLLIYGNLHNNGQINLKPSTGVVANAELYGIMVINGANIPMLNDVVFKTGASVSAEIGLDINGNVTIETGAAFNDGGLVHNVGGNWSINGTGNYIASGTIVFDGMVNTVNDNTSATSVTFNHVTFSGGGAGSLQENVTVNGNLWITNNTVLQTALSITSLGDFTVDSGSFYTQTAGTTAFAGTGVQSIELNGTNSFYNATFNNGGANSKSIAGNMSVTNAFTLSGGATISGSGTQTVSNGVRVDGVCNLSGVLVMKGGNLSTSNASNQIVLGTAELRIEGNVGLSITSPATSLDLIMGNNLNVVNGYLIIGNNTRVVGQTSYQLKVDASRSLYVRGGNNFPSGFGTYDLAPTSNVIYDAAMAQTVRGGIVYGHLTLGGVSGFRKIVDGALDINGNLTINNASVLDLQSYTHTLSGNIANGSGGSIDGASAILTLDADDTNQSIAANGTGYYRFYDLNIAQNGATASRTKTFATGCNIEIYNDFNITNGSGSLSIMLIVAMNDNGIGGAPHNWNLGEYCQMQTTSTDFYTVFSSKFSGARTLDVNSSVYYSLNGAQTVANGFIYGNMAFNGGNKTARGALDINGAISVVGGTPVFYDGGFTHTLAGNWQLSNSANYTSASATGTIVFDGIDQIMNGATFNHVVIANTGIVAVTPTNTAVLGNLTVESGARLYLLAKNVSIGGHMEVKGSGVFSQTLGTTTFNGSSIQTVNANTSSAFGGFTVNKPNAVGQQTVKVNSGMQVLGNISIAQDAGILDVSGQEVTLGGSLYLYTNAVETGDVLLAGGSILTLNGIDAQSVRNRNLNPLSLGNVIFTGAGDKTIYYEYSGSPAVNVNGNWTISGSTVKGSNSEIYVRGNWENNGTFQHDASRTVYFDGADQSISSTTFRNVNFGGTGTKTLSGNITANGNVTLSAATLNANNQTITLTGNWDNNAVGAVFIPGSGKVIFTGTGANVYTGTSSGIATGKGFFDFEVNLASGSATLQGDLQVTNNLTVNTGTFTTGTFDVWVGGNLDISATFSHSNSSSVLTLNGSGGIKTFKPNNTAFRGIVVNAPGTVYQTEGDFSMQYADMEIQAGELRLNKRTLTVNNNNRKILVNGGSLLVDENSSLVFANSGQGINMTGGALKIVGSSTNLAYVTGLTTTFAINQTGGTIHAINYYLQNARITISGGTIDATDNFSHGTFSGTVSTGAYLTLTGLNFADFAMEDITFNSGASKNIARALGTGTVTVEDASGALAGEAFEADNGTPGTLIEWTYPAGFFWDNDHGDNNWHNPLNWSGNALPGINDIVYLNHDYLTSAYTVNVSSGDATVKRVMMDTQGGAAIGLTIQGGKNLTLIENLSIGSANATFTQGNAASVVYVGKNWTNLGTYNHGNSTVIFNGTGGESTIYSGGTGTGKSFYNLSFNAPGANYNLGSPTNVLNDLTITNGQLSAAAAANTLYVGGNWFIDADTGGLFDPSSSIVMFNGADQSITNGTFYNFTTAGTGTKTLQSNIKASYNLTIGAGTTIDAGQFNILVSRYWINNGGALGQYGLGTVIFDGTSAQQIDAGTSSTSFHHIDFRNAGSKTLMRDINTSGSVVVNSGSGVVYLGTYHLSGIGTDNAFTNYATVHVQGVNNFPGGFETIDLAATSRVNYYADMDQLVFPATYGHIGFGRNTNGVSTTKTALGDFNVLGNIYLADGTTTLDMATNDASITLTGTISTTAGSLINWGTGDKATLTHVGGDWNISSNLAGFNHLVLAGTGDKYTNGNLHITGNVLVKQGVDLMMYSTSGVANFRNMTSDGTGSFAAEAGARVFNARPSSDGAAIPVGFNNYQLDAGSTYYMYSSAGVDQTLFTGSNIEYGNLYFRNAKNVTSDGVADLIALGNWDVSASTYVDGGKNMRVAGSNIYLTGYTPSSSAITLTLNGVGNQTISDNVDNNLLMCAMEFAGGGIKTIGDGNDVCTIEGNLTIQSGVTVVTSRNIAFGGTNWTNNGIYTQTGGTLTFNGNSNQTIKAGAGAATNYFYNVTFANPSTKTFVTDGTDINGAFTISSGNVDLGSLSHKIYGSMTNTSGGSLMSTSADIIFDGASQNINTPAFAVNNVTLSGSGTKRMFSDWTVNGNLLINSGATLNTSDNLVPTYHNIGIRGNWTNNGTFTVNTSTVNFNGNLSQIDIASGGSNFYNVEFAAGPVLYRLQSAMTRFSRSMAIGAGAELTLNSKTLVLGSNIALGKNFTVNGTLRVNENAVLKFNNQSSQGVLNVSGAFYLVGTDATNIATLTREVAGVTGAETQINILSGATFGARYYLIEYLQDAGMNLLTGSVLHSTYNLSDGAFQNIRNASNVRYLNLECDYAGGPVSNIAFNYAGTPVVGTHYNVWRQAAATPVVFDAVGGSLGNYKFERDNEALASASSGLLQWPAVTETNWKGALNTNWHEAGNWDNGVPTATLEAVITDRANDPVIAYSNASCKKLTITNGTLIINNNRNLTVAGDMEIGTGTNTGILSVSGSSSVITVGGSWTRGTNSIYMHGNSSVVFNSSVGTANITPRTSRFYNVEFNNASTTFYLVGTSIGIDGNWVISNGTVVPSSTNYVYDLKGDFLSVNGTFNATAVSGGTVNLTGIADQTVSNGNFNILNVSGSGVKHFSNHIAVAGTTTINSTMFANTGCVVDFNGDVTVSSSGTFADGGGIHTFAGVTWTGTGAYSGSGTIVFDRAGDQAINGGMFYNLTVNGTGGIFYLNSNATVNNNMTIVNGINYADLRTNSIVNPNGTGTFTLENGEAVYVRGADNFPKGFGSYALGETSLTYYNGTQDQTIDGISYGHLILNNAFTKTLGGNTEVKGNLTFNNSTLDVSSGNYSLAVGGAWTNNGAGHFICHSGNVVFNGLSSDQSISVGVSNTNNFYDLTVAKGAGNVVVNNNTLNNFVIRNNLTVTGGQFHANGRTIYVGGNFVASNSGLFSSNTGTYYLNKPTGVANIGTNGSSLLNMTINSGAVYTVIDNLSLIGDFRLEAGQLNGNGKVISLGNGNTDVAVIGGTYKIGAGGTLMLGDGTSLTVTSSGQIEVVGSTSAMATVTHNATGRYNFVIEGVIAAKYYLFEYMSSAGVYLAPGSTIHATNNFSEGTFTNGTTTGPMLRVENNQSFVAPNYIANVIFPVNPGGGAYNVAKTTASTGTLEFYNSTGVFSGENYDNDPYNLINWTGPVKLTWNGSVSTNWNNLNNWTASYGPSIVPTGDEDVVIATAVNQPILTTYGQKTKNLTINSGASILLNTPNDGGMADLDVNGDLTINGSLVSVSSNDYMTVEGNWTRGTTGTVALNGNVRFDGVGGARVINNRGTNFHSLTIAGTSLYQLGYATTVKDNLVMESGSFFDITSANHALTVYGNWQNSGTFNSRAGKVTLLGSKILGLLNGGTGDFYDLDINASSNAYQLTSNIGVKRALYLISGTLSVNGYMLNMGDGSGTDDLTVTGSLNLNGGSVLNMGNGARVNVNSAGSLTLVGSGINNRAAVTSLSGGRYTLKVNSGGHIAAQYYQIVYTDEQGLNIQNGASIDNVYNLSDGYFTNGFPATGTYLTLLAESGEEIIVKNVIFDGGPLYNVTRTSGTTVFYFVDASGTLGNYTYEKDVESPDANSGLVRWSLLQLYTWLGHSSDWGAVSNWYNGVIPDGFANAIIPLGTPNNPVVNEGTLALSNNLSIASGASLTLSPGARMTVNGNIVNTGATVLVKNTVDKPTSLLTYGTIASPVTIQWVYPNGRYMYVGHSVDGVNYNNYDVPASNAINLYRYTGTAWSAITSVAGLNGTSENVLEGYSVKFNDATNVTVSHTGILRKGDYARSINGWNLVGNPYQTYLDLESTGLNLGNSLSTVWTTTNASGSTVYATYNISTKVGANGGTRYVSPGQSFWVRNYSSSILSIDNTVRTHASGALKSARTVDDVLRIVLSGGAVSDENVIVFREYGSENYSTIFDSEKRFSTGNNEVSLYTQKGGNNLIINALPEDNMENRVIPLFLTIGSNSTGTLKLQATNIAEFMPDVDVFLQDKVTGESFNLREKVEYIFTTTSSVSNQNRFELSFKTIEKTPEVVTGVDETAASDNIVITAVGIGNKTIVKVKDLAFAGKVGIEVMDAQGKVYKNVLSGNERTELEAPANTQFYMVRVIYKGEMKSFKIMNSPE
ncbi:MAG: hypothetical protein QM786_14865 [Breznakibacter sp.]